MSSETVTLCHMPARSPNDGEGPTPARALCERFWVALYTRDWEAIASFFGPTSTYTDLCNPSEDVAVGPNQIVARLRLGLEPISGYEHDLIAVVAEGATVVT